ncbi:MAG: acetylserotonin O-methyltransferase [Acidobacteriota bacterium]|nr:acetylserotonin O-methyltransferase [Acidobacteriota bacterium]
MASAFQESSLLFAASDLGIFGKLDELGSADIARLAKSLSLDERGLGLLLNGAVAIGLLQKTGRQYSNSPEAKAFLVPGRRGDLSGALRYNRDVYGAWGKLRKLAQTGRPVEDPQLHLGDDAARTHSFVMSMHGKAMAMAEPVLSMVDVRGRKQLLDVGGGPGTFSALIAQREPDIRCTVLELPPIAAIGRDLVALQGQSERVAFLPGDYHETPFPENNDVILFFGMMHQEPPATIRDLLSRAYRALVPDGLVCVMDMMTDATHVNPPFSAMFAINMALTKEHGWVFSDTELREWINEAGFQNIDVRPLPPPIPHWIVSASKA